MRELTQLTKSCILGIDPGNKGACSLLDLDGNLVHYFKMPTRIEVPGTQKKRIDGLALYNLLSNYDILTCYIEKQAYQNAKLIANYGICMAVLDVLEIPFVAIAAASWMLSLKKQLDIENIKNKDKEFTFHAFDMIFPEIELPIKEKGLRDDDIADASLMAYLCFLNIKKEEPQSLTSKVLTIYGYS